MDPWATLVLLFVKVAGELKIYTGSHIRNKMNSINTLSFLFVIVISFHCSLQAYEKWVEVLVKEGMALCAKAAFEYTQKS